jgi:hypothetical protein
LLSISSVFTGVYDNVDVHSTKKRNIYWMYLRMIISFIYKLVATLNRKHTYHEYL